MNRIWLFNTDETEIEGTGTYQSMLQQSVIAAWGDCRELGAERMLNKPDQGETVFFFLAGTGIIAKGQVVGHAFRSDVIFGKSDEYHRGIDGLVVLDHPLATSKIYELTGYSLPARHIVCQMHDETGVSFIEEYFSNSKPNELSL